jgi:pantoate--beta-alanine ligase
MNTLRTVAQARAALAQARAEGATIGLVPTMGALHDGHLSLLRRARRDCDVVVMSLFVNQTQFNESGDLAAYPRDEQRDLALAERERIDYVFAPPAAEVYPAGFATTVSVAEVTDMLEGAHRGRAHFDGVTTVVTKLFNMIGPDRAYFGQKDAQQAIVIKRLVRDLDMPVRIEVCPTIREPDGLALSSRNAHLSPAERERAAALNRALRAAGAAVAVGETDPAAVATLARAELSANDVQLDYFALVSTDSLTPVAEIDGDVLALIAARVGNTRLIDNQLLSTSNGAGSNIDDEVATLLGAPTTS